MQNRMSSHGSVARARRWANLLLSSLAMLCLFSGTAFAQNRSLSEGPVVRRELLFRSNKIELSPALGIALDGLYQREIMVGVAARYHLTNSFSVGLNAHFSPFQLDTSVVDNLATANPEVSRQVEYSHQMLLTDVHVSYVPISGKLNLFGNLFHYDFQIGAGVGGALLASDADDLGGFKFGPALSAGIRLFVTDNIALSFRSSTYLYSSALAQRIVLDRGIEVAQPIDEQFRAHTVGLIGVSFFLPGELRVSR